MAQDVVTTVLHTPAMDCAAEEWKSGERWQACWAWKAWFQSGRKDVGHARKRRSDPFAIEGSRPRA